MDVTGCRTFPERLGKGSAGACRAGRRRPSCSFKVTELKRKAETVTRDLALHGGVWAAQKIQPTPAYSGEDRANVHHSGEMQHVGVPVQDMMRGPETPIYHRHA
ncbi:hypothetical protein NDU88_001338 [Pleurodeles waltl]|uniref:Uncharacterized protein n=1 Tax=Pleurodeles waltl TaxID=8319 RepID=A0AAV7UA03_PLEWA|nr:hypothetical protein NDU88_001338 [Pleurodeles waltl]